MFAQLNIPRQDALRVYLLLRGFTSLLFMMLFTVNMVYQVTVVELSPLQLVLVGTTLELTVFLLEVPTGVVADVISRRLSILIGYTLIGLGFMLEGLLPRFEAVLMAQVLWGTGYTFTSGATQAWIADEVGEQRAGNAFVRGAQLGHIGGFVGILLATGLGTLHVRLPIVLAGALFVLFSGVLALIMPEDGFQRVPPAERNTWHSMWQTLRAGLRLIRLRHVLLMILALAAINGLYSEGYDRLWTAHLLTNFDLPWWEPVLWFGLINAVGSLLGLAVNEIVRRRVDLANERALIRAQLLLTAARVIFLVIFALAGGWWLALIALWSFGMARGAGYPLFEAWLNRQVESNVRATVFSVTGQADAISQVAGGPVVGAIGQAYSLRAALITSSAILTPAIALLTVALRRSNPAPAEGDPLPAATA